MPKADEPGAANEGDSIAWHYVVTNNNPFPVTFTIVDSPADTTGANISWPTNAFLAAGTAGVSTTCALTGSPADFDPTAPL